MRASRRWAIARYVFLILFAVPWVGVPIWLALAASMKTAGEAAQLNLSLPTVWAVAENYGTVFHAGNYMRALGNSLLVSVPTILTVLGLGAAAAWGFGRSRSSGMQVGYFAIVISILIPPALLPTIFLLRELHIDGFTLGYVLVMIGTRMGLVVFLATGFIRNLPPDLEEAATIDGASRFQIFRIIILPLLSPVLFVGGVLLTISVWADFFFATFLLPGSSRATLPLALYSFATSSVQSFRWNLVFAHVVMTSLPLLIVYIFTQSKVVGGLSEGAVKG